MARGWLKALKEPELAERVVVVGLVDLSEAAAWQLRDEFELGNVRVETDIEVMLAAVKPEMVFDVVVPSARFSVVKIALAHGCHVLSEKPMASSLAEAEQLISLAAQADRIHAVVQNRRYIPGVRRIRDLIETGALGELTALHADFFIGAHFGGFRDQMQNVLLLDMAIHTFDAARFMSGKDAEAVYCYEHNPRGSWYAHGAAANAIFELGGDIVFTYRGSWAAEGANTSWESSWRVIGTRGTLLWDGREHFEARVTGGDDGFFRPLTDIEVPEVTDENLTRGHRSVLNAFVQAIDKDRPPETAGSDNIKSLAMVFGAIESARTRTRQSILAGVSEWAIL